MKTLEDTRDLLCNLIYDLERIMYERKDDPYYNPANNRENVEMLGLAVQVIAEKLAEEKANEGDRLDRLLDKLEDNGGRTLHGISCVCVTLSTMEEHLYSMGEYAAAGRCNQMQHKYLD